jgi:hypothetical protein
MHLRRFCRAGALIGLAVLLTGCVIQATPRVVTGKPYADVDGCARQAALADMQSVGEHILTDSTMRVTEFADGNVQVEVETRGNCPTPAAKCEKTSCQLTAWILTVVREGAECRVVERGSRRAGTVVLMADCPTPAPSPAPTLPPAEATASAVAMETLLRDFTGEYVSTGKNAEMQISITLGGTYAFVRKEASGTEHRREGTLSALGNAFWFDQRGPDSAALLPVMWGERRYLVEANALSRFCSPESGEPRTTRQGFFYLHDGDWSLPAKGIPLLFDGAPACP